MARGSDIGQLSAIALGMLLLAGLGLPARPSLTLDSAFAKVRDRIGDAEYMKPAQPIILEPVTGGFALLVAANPANCHMCGAEISVFYFRPGKDDWRVAGAWPKLLEQGSWGEVGDIEYIDVGTSNTALSFTDDFISGGCFLGSMWVMELTPTRPIVRLGAPLDSDNFGDVGPDDPLTFSVTATVDPLADGPGLQIHYQGSGPHKRRVDQVVRYSGPGDVWRPQPGEFTGRCTYTTMFALAVSPGESEPH